jgi:hypothetical protein
LIHRGETIGGARCYLASHAIPSQHHPTCEAVERVALVIRPGPRRCARALLRGVGKRRGAGRLERTGPATFAALPIALEMCPCGRIRWFLFA